MTQIQKYLLSQADQKYRNFTLPLIPNVDAVNLPSGLTKLSKWSFWSCPNLAKVIIPSTVTFIGTRAFNNNSALQHLHIPASVATMEWHAIEACYNLTIFTEVSSKPSGWHSEWNYNGCYTTWGYDNFTFQYADSGDGYAINSYTGTNDEVTFPAFYNGEPVVDLNTSAFENNTILVGVTIPSTVRLISRYCFKNCSNLSRVTFQDDPTIDEDTVTELHKQAFQGCSSLGDVHFGEYVSDELEDDVFYHCDQLQFFTVSPNSYHLATYGGALYNKDRTTLLIYPEGLNETVMSFPETVTKIARFAVQSNDYIETVILPSTITEIDELCFSCANLTTLKIPSSVVTIYGRTARSCPNATIYCQVSEAQPGWSSNWNSDNRPVVWNASF